MSLRILIFIFFATLIAQTNVKLTQSIVSFTGSHPFHDWTGISTKVNLNTNCSETEICDFTFIIPWTSFESGNDNRDNNMLYYVNAFDYPNIEMKFQNIHLNNIKNNVYGKLNFGGEENDFNIPLDFKKNQNQIKVDSDFKISLSQFNIDRPTLLMIPINDTIHVHVKMSGELFY